MGMGFFFAGIGALIGTPIGGALISADDGGYLYAQMFAGSSLFAGFVVILLAVWRKGNVVAPTERTWKTLVLK